MPTTTSDLWSDPILRILVVDGESGAPVSPTGAVVRFARVADEHTASEPVLEQAWELALPLEDGRGDELRADDGLVTIDLEVLERRHDLTYPARPPDWKAGWLARVEIRAEGYLPATTDWIPAPMRAEHEPNRVRLSSAPRIAGRAVDERGAPLEGVELELIRPIVGAERLRIRSCFGVLYRDDHDVLVSATTDIAGAFSLPYTEDAKIRIRARVLGRTPVATEPIPLLLGTPPPPCMLVMPVPDGGIEGVVRGFDGAPAAGALVVVCGPDGFAQLVTTGPAGRYRVPLPPGRYRVHRADPSAESWSLTWSRGSWRLRSMSDDAPAVEPAQFSVEVRAGGFTTWDLDTRCPHEASTIVHIDAEGEDVATLPVRLSRDCGEEAVELAWPRGTDFEYLGDSPALFPDLPAGRYRLNVGMEEVEVELSAGEITELGMELKTATVAGRLLDSNGRGVVARLELDEPAPPPESRFRSTRNDAHSEADGTFHFYLVRPGECRLRVYVERDGKEVLVHDAALSLPRKGRHEPIVRLDRPS